MKKFLLIGLGAVFLGGAAMSLTMASREAYQAYLYRKTLERRSMRRYSTPRTVTSRGYDIPARSTKQYVSTQDALRYLNGPRTQRGYVARTEDYNIRSYRPMSYGYGHFSNSGGARYTLQAQNVQLTEKFDTYANDFFSLQIPTNWMPEYSKGYFSVENQDGVSAKIKRFTDTCDGESFLMCSVARSKDENHKNPLEKITVLSTMHRRAWYTDKILGVPQYQSNVYTETFIGTQDGEEFVVSRYYVEGFDGETFLIETKAPRKYSDELIMTAQKMFETFRVYPLQIRKNTDNNVVFVVQD